MLLKYANGLVGALLLLEAARQRRSGVTRGLPGKGVVCRDSEPGYFAMMFWARVFLGILSLAAAIWIPG